MDHFSRVSRRDRWLRAGRRHASRVFGRVFISLCVAGVFAVLAMLSGAAHAYGTVPSSGTSAGPAEFTVAGLNTYRPTKPEACTAASTSPLYCTSGFKNCAVVSVSETHCTLKRTYNSDNTVNQASYTFQSRATTVIACPTNSTSTSGSCVCNSGYKSNGTSCVTIGACDTIASGLNLLNTTVQSGSGVGSLTTCYGGCALTSNFGGTGTNNSWWLWPPFAATGANCQGTDNNGDDTDPPPLVCEKPKCPGTVNGTAVCVLCESTTAAGPTTTTTAPSGAASAPEGTTEGTTSSETVCQNGVCTTTETTRAPTGEVISEKETDRPADDYCAENPQAPSCEGNKSSFSGSCGGFSCEGDAVQCAIASDQYARHCQVFDTPTALTAIGDAALAGGVRSAEHPGNAPEAVSLNFATSIDQTNRLGGGGLSDLTVPVPGGPSVTLPFSQLGAPLAMLGNLLVGVAMFAALFIVFGRGK